jgi:hypothetical protein
MEQSFHNWFIQGNSFWKKSNVTWWKLEIFSTCAQKHAFPLLVLLNSLVMWINGGKQRLHSERGPGRPVTTWWNSVSAYQVHSIVFEKALVEPFSTQWNGVSRYRVHSISHKTTHIIMQTSALPTVQWLCDHANYDSLDISYEQLHLPI